MYVETTDGSFNEQTIHIILTTAVVEVMRCTVYVRIERARKTRLHSTRGTVRLHSNMNVCSNTSHQDTCVKRFCRISACCLYSDNNYYILYSKSA